MSDHPKKEAVLLGGLPASGKTTAALGLKQSLGSATVIDADADAVWLDVMGKPPGEPLRSLDEVTTRQKLQWMWRMIKLTREAMNEGNVAIVPCCFSGKRARHLFETATHALGADLREFWLVASPQTAAERATQRADRWLAGSPEANNPSAGMPTAEDPAIVEQTVEPKWVRINADQPREVVLGQILSNLRSGAGRMVGAAVGG